MAELSHIQWTDATWNPWYGCQKISPGCKFCYMYREMKRYGRNPSIVQRSKTTFNDPLKWQHKLRQGQTEDAPRFVFTCSWSDFFIAQADPWRPEAWQIIRKCPDLIFLIVVKRIERAEKCLPPDWSIGYPNVMLMVSAERQQEADERILQLLWTPARWHGVSLEPLLEPITLTEVPLAKLGPPGEHLMGSCLDKTQRTLSGQLSLDLPRLDWVIVGGESGDEPDVRPMMPDWPRKLRDQCVNAGVPFFFKQWGEYAPVEILDSLGYVKNRVMRRVGRKASGRVLDGVEWNETPWSEVTA